MWNKTYLHNIRFRGFRLPISFCPANIHNRKDNNNKDQLSGSQMCIGCIKNSTLKGIFVNSKKFTWLPDKYGENLQCNPSLVIVINTNKVVGGCGQRMLTFWCQASFFVASDQLVFKKKWRRNNSLFESVLSFLS